MNKYLIDILNEKGEVYVGGLGLITKKTYSTGLNHVKLNADAQEGEVTLAKYLADKEGVSEQDAENKVAKYVQEIEAELAKGNNYEIFGLGRFSRTDAGNIYFITTNDSHRSTFQNDPNFDTSIPDKSKEDKEKAKKEKEAVTETKDTPETKEEKPVAKETAPPVKKEEKAEADKKEVQDSEKEEQPKETNTTDQPSEEKTTEKETTSETTSEEDKMDSDTERPKVRLKSTVAKKSEEDKPEDTSKEETKPEVKQEEVKETPVADPKEKEEPKKANEEPKKEEKKEVVNEPAPKKEEETTKSESTSPPVEEVKPELEDHTDRFSDHEPDLVNKHVQEILKIKDAVVIPGYGTITGETASNSGLLKFSFDPAAKSGDETLAAYLVVKNKMKEEKARDILSNYTTKIDESLEKGAEFTIPGVGKFAKDEAGKREFVTSSAPIWKKDDTEDPLLKKATAAEVKEVSSKLEKEEESSKSESNTETSSDTSKSTAEVKKEEKDVSKGQEEKKKESNVKDQKEAAKKGPKGREKQKPKKVEKKKKKFPWVLVIILVVVLGGGGTAGFIFIDDIKQLIGAEVTADSGDLADDSTDAADIQDDLGWGGDSEDSPDTTGATDTDEGEGVPDDDMASNDDYEEDEMSADDDAATTTSTVSEDDMEVSDPVETYENNSNTSSDANTGETVSYYSGSEQYHIVGGVFEQSSNADEFVSEMKGKGYDARNLGVINGYNFVAVKSYATSKEATDDLRNVESDVPGAWVFKYPK